MRPERGSAWCGAVMLLLIAIAPAMAQDAVPAPAPAYAVRIERLSELMGALHYLRRLCNDPDAREWRERLGKLVGSEGFTEQERAQFAGAFNRGYRTFSESYHSCNEAAREAIRTYLAESLTLVRDLRVRYAH